MANEPVHDRFFKHTFGNPRHAEGVFRMLLPAELVMRVDWSTLGLRSGSFVDEVLQDRHSDLLYSVAVDGQTTLLYVLFEHQSSVDPLMPFRVLRYIVRIWDRWLDKHKGATRLPAVVPIVMYHGDEPWSAPTDLLEIIDIEEDALAVVCSYLPRLRFVLDDLAGITEEEIRARQSLSAMAKVAQAAMALLRAENGEAFLHRFGDLLREVEAAGGGIPDLVALGYYVVARSGNQRRPGVFMAMQEELSRTGEQVVVTIADALRAEGRDEEARRVIRKLLARLGVEVDASVDAKLTRADTSVLEETVDQLLDTSEPRQAAEVLRRCLPDDT